MTNLQSIYDCKGDSSDNKGNTDDDEDYVEMRVSAALLEPTELGQVQRIRQPVWYIVSN